MHKTKYAIITGFCLLSNDERDVMVFITIGEDKLTHYLELYDFK